MKRNFAHDPSPGSLSGSDALFTAVRDGDLNHVMCLLESGILPNVCNKEGWMPLHVAALWNKAPLIEPLVIVGSELEARTPPDGKYHVFSGCTPLHCTVERDALDAARELIRCGADINARDADGSTPLRLAVETSGTYHLVSPLLAKFFIEEGADINAYDNGGYTIFHEASKAIDLAPGHRESQEVIEMLQQRKAWMW